MTVMTVLITKHAVVSRHWRSCQRCSGRTSSHDAAGATTCVKSAGASGDAAGGTFIDPAAASGDAAAAFIHRDATAAAFVDSDATPFIHRDATTAPFIHRDTTAAFVDSAATGGDAAQPFIHRAGTLSGDAAAFVDDEQHVRQCPLFRSLVVASRFPAGATVSEFIDRSSGAENSFSSSWA